MTDQPNWPPPPPPACVPPPPAARTRRPVALWIALGAVVALLVGVGATAAVVLTGQDEAVAGEPVLVEPVADAGPDPFVVDVAVSATPIFPDEVRSVAAATADGLAADPATGTRTATGTTDALYGGTGGVGGCDPDQLVEFLATHPAQGAAWAGVHGIAPDVIDDFVAGLTPVVLLHDTVVTNYGFVNGVATPRQSVLQAGTAVLVDESGAPAVRCACGNPLTAATVRDLPAADVQGARWAGYDPAATVVVTAGPPTTTFRLVDIATGTIYQRPAGLAARSEPALLAATPTGIQRSTDAQQWSVVGTVDRGSLDHLDAGPDLVVAVGGERSTADRPGAGAISTSADGRHWAEPIAVQDHLIDVAYGDGGWLAVGSMTPAGDPGETFDLVTYRSVDGTDWQRTTTAVPVPEARSMWPISIDHGNGTWLVGLVGILGDGTIQATLSSADGSTWTAHQTSGADGAITAGRAFNGQTWGMTGVSEHYDNGLDQRPRTELWVGASADGITWLRTAGNPAGINVSYLSCAGDRGWMGVGAEGGWNGLGPWSIRTSADLVSWSPLGTVPVGGVTDVVAVGAGTGPDTGRCGTPAEPTAPGVGAVACALDETTADGTSLVAVVDSGTIDCVLMRDRWTAYFRWTGPKAGTMAGVDFGDGWTCSIIPLSATLPGQTDWGYRGQVGGCRHPDGREFTVYPADRAPGGGVPAPTGPAASTGPAAPAGGDLGLSMPISQPACDGSGIVIVASAINPGSYAADVQAALDRFPGSTYLRTDLTGCSSLNQISSIGTRIYAIYRPIGTDVAAICADVGRTGGYGKWLDNSTDSSATIDCG